MSFAEAQNVLLFLFNQLNVVLKNSKYFNYFIIKYIKNSNTISN